jgi:hypothetical protein
MTLDQQITDAEEQVLNAEQAVMQARQQRCSSIWGWKQELKRRRAALAKLKQERGNV